MATAVQYLKASAWRDYLSLAKPRVIWLHLVTAASAMFLAAEGLPPGLTILLTLGGGGLVVAASNAINCYFDRDIDGKMSRTRLRPLPSGRLRPHDSLLFGMASGSAGLFILGLLVGPVPALLAVTALAYYVVAYTLLAKRRTRWNTIIGSAAGAIPPLVGWAAVADGFTVVPFLLFSIIALWTVPHFWSLGILKRDDYEQAGLSVLPRNSAAAGVLVCSFLLVAAHLLLMPAAGLGYIYLGAALSLGGLLLALSVRLQLQRARPARAARQLYLYSIIYLLGLSAVIIFDRLTASVWAGYATF